MTIPEAEVKVKLSLCNVCLGIVRAAVEHEMNTKMKNEFLKEVMKHDLSVKTISLSEYRQNKHSWCNCKP